MRDADRRAVGISVRGREIQPREDDGVGGAAQLAFEFQHDALLRDVERKRFARYGGGDQGDRDGLQDCGREVKVGLGRFDFTGGKEGIGAGLGESGHKASLSGKNGVRLSFHLVSLLESSSGYSFMSVYFKCSCTNRYLPRSKPWSEGDFILFRISEKKALASMC